MAAGTDGMMGSGLGHLGHRIQSMNSINSAGDLSSGTPGTGSFGATLLPPWGRHASLLVSQMDAPAHSRMNGPATTLNMRVTGKDCFSSRPEPAGERSAASCRRRDTDRAYSCRAIAGALAAVDPVWQPFLLVVLY